MGINKNSYRECPICGSEKNTRIHSQKFISISSKYIEDSYDIVSCDNCGFVYANTKSTQEDFNNYYKELSKYEDEKSTGSGNDETDIIRLNKNVHIIEKYIKDKSMQIIDIGCGNGGLLAELKKKGYKKLLGIDPSYKCVEYMKRNNIDAIQANIFELANIEKADCIILTHVLEHIRDLEMAINSIKKVMKDSSILFIEVPNALQYSNNFIVPYYYFDKEHINHFDKYSLANLLRQFELVFINEDIINLEEGNRYPILQGVFKNNSINNEQIKYNSCGKDSVMKFKEESEAKNNFEAIEALVNENKEIMIWGAGQYTYRLLSNTNLINCNIKGFIDNDPNKIGRKINKIKIYDKTKLKQFDGTIVIASAIHSKQILAEIEKMKISNKVVIL